MASLASTDVKKAAKLKKEGLIKNYGLSETSKEWLQSAHEISPVCAIQQEWSLLTRELEEDLVPYCRDNNIGIIGLINFIFLFIISVNIVIIFIYIITINIFFKRNLGDYLH